MPLKPEPAVTLPEGNGTKGAKIFKAKCAQCHTLKAGEGSKTRPNLHAMFGAKAALDGKYSGYSEPLKNSGIIWSDAHLSEFLVAPKKYVPGVKMVFAGMKKEQERADLAAYLHEATA